MTRRPPYSRDELAARYALLRRIHHEKEARDCANEAKKLVNEILGKGKPSE